jgi:hypothetical protein
MLLSPKRPGGDIAGRVYLPATMVAMSKPNALLRSLGKKPRAHQSHPDTTVRDLPPPRQAAQHPFMLAPFAEPRIEPEIVFRLALP